MPIDPPPSFAARDHFVRHADVASRVVVAARDAARPEVTIAIPTFRRPGMLREAIASALAQRGPVPMEVLVVDNDADGPSNDEVDAVVRGFDAPELGLVRNATNLGMFGNWNRCLTLARGRWVTILNDDDLLLPGFVERSWQQASRAGPDTFVQTAYFMRDARRAGVPDRRLGSRWWRPGRVRPIDAKRFVLENPRAGCLGTLYPREMAIAAGGFDPDEFPTADYLFHVRLLVAGRRGLLVDEPLAVYRIHENESANVTTMTEMLVSDAAMRRGLRTMYTFGGAGMELFVWASTVANFHHARRLWRRGPDAQAILERTGVRVRGGRIEHVAAAIVRQVLAEVLV